jgi:tRNA threonylcarbamoyladenosine biosynthesis protein TsaB
MAEELLLTLDTATGTGSVAVSRGELLLGETILNVHSTHSDRLLPSLHRLLQELDLDLPRIEAFAVVLGPGSFTGLRVGVATVQGLALGSGRPVIGVSSLQTLAMQAPFASLPVCTLLDARKNEVYAGLFHWNGNVAVPLRPEAVLSPDDLLDSLEGETIFVGSGAVAYRTLIVRRLGRLAHFLPWSLNLPRASQAAVLALADWRDGKQLVPLAHLLPRYIRPSEAELLWARRGGRTLNEG